MTQATRALLLETLNHRCDKETRDLDYHKTQLDRAMNLLAECKADYDKALEARRRTLEASTAILEITPEPNQPG